MATALIGAIREALVTVLQLLVRLALPLSLLTAAGLIGFVWLNKRREGDLIWPKVDWRRAFGFALVCLAVFVGFRALRVLNPIATDAIAWKESAEATEYPSEDAPAIYQFGPSVSAMVDRTYTRTISIPPYLLERIGTEGIGMLAPYLSDPSAEGVIKLVDTFRRSGQELVLTREVTRRDEDPLPFTNSSVNAEFERKGGRSYELKFEGKYEFSNSSDTPVQGRFMFALPYEGTVRDLSIKVGEEAVETQNQEGAYEWIGDLAAGERKMATVRYTISGSRAWHYDIGSRRRKVEQFALTANSGGPAKFLRGSLQPTEVSGEKLRWELSNVVTAQQVAISFPPDLVSRDAFLQALSVMPASFVVFAVGIIIVAISAGVVLGPSRFLLALFGFGLGLGSVLVLAAYVGTVPAVLAGPLLGAALASVSLGARALLPGLVAALLPAAFLSAEHSGIILLALFILAFGAVVVQWSRPQAV